MKRLVFLILSQFLLHPLFAQSPLFNYPNGTAQRNYVVGAAITAETPTVTNGPSGSYAKGVVTGLIDFRYSPSSSVAVTQPGQMVEAGNNYLIASGTGSIMSLDFGGAVNAYSGNPTFGSPFGVARIAAGDLISDPATDRIYLMQGNNRLTMGGNPTTPQAGYSNGSSNSNPLFDDPMSLLAIPFLSNKVWVADKNNNRVRIFDVPNQSTVDLTITGLTLSSPVGLAYDDVNKFLYITDSHRLIRVAINTTTGQSAGAATVVAGSTTAGDADGAQGVSLLNQPSGIAFQSAGNNIIIADRLNHKVKLYSALTGEVITLAGNGSAGDALGQGSAARFNQPVAVYCKYNSKEISVSDYGNNKIKTITVTSAYTVNPALPAGLFLHPYTGAISGTPTTYTPLANYTVTLDNGTGTAQVVLPIQVLAQGPSGLTYSSNSNVYTVGTTITNLVPGNTSGVIASYSIQPTLPPGLSLNTTTGVISGTPTQGSPQTTYVITGTNTGGSTTASISIYVQGPPYNMGFSRSQAVLLQGAPVYIMALPFSFPAPTSYRLTSPSALPTGLTLNTTTGEITGTPTVTTANATYTVEVTNAYGTSAGTIEIEVQPAPVINYTNPSPYPAGQAITSLVPATTGMNVAQNSHTWSNSGVDPGGVVAYLVFNGSKWVVPAGGNSLGSGSLSGGGMLFQGPPGGTCAYLIVDAQYFLYNVSNASHTITKMTSTVGSPTAVRSWGSGTAGYLDGAAYQAQFGTMGQIATDPIGSRLWIPDRTNKRIRMIDARTNQVTTIAGNGSTGTTNGSALSASFTDPAAVTYGADGNVYVLDQTAPGQATIRKIDLTAGTVSDFTTINESPALIQDYLITDKGGEMYVSLGNTYQARMKRISSDGSIHEETPGNGNVISSIAVMPDNGNIACAPFANINGTTVGYFFTPGEVITIQPSLFPGLSFDPITGTISGTPTGAGLTAANATQVYKVTATNRVGIFSSNVTLSVVRPPAGLSYQYSPWNIEVGSTTPPNTINTPTLTVSGIPAETYAISPALPAGLSLNPATGLISGITVSLSAAQVYTITATNAYGSAATNVTISIIDKPRPAYTTPVVLLKNIGMTPLTPTNTGGAVLSPAYERVSTLFNMPAGFTVWDGARDAAGNFYFVGTNGGTRQLLKVDPTGVNLLNTWTLNAMANAPRALTINGNNAYIGEFSSYDVYQLNISNNSSAETKIITAISQQDNVWGNSSFRNLQYYNGKLYSSGEDVGISVWTVAGAPGTPAAPSLDFNQGTGSTYNNYGWPNLCGSCIQELRIGANGTFVYPDGGGIKVTTYNSGTLGFNAGTNYATQYTANDFNASGTLVIAPGTNGGTDQFKTLSGGTITPFGSSISSGGSVDGFIHTAQGGNAPQFADMKRIFVDPGGDIFFLEATTGKLRKYENRVAYAISPALPNGITINNQTGVISGTPTVEQAATNYTVTAYNSVGSRSTIVNITVGAPLSFNYQLSSNTELNSADRGLFGAVANPRFGNGTAGTAFKSVGSGGITLQTEGDVAVNFGFGPALNPSGVTFSISPALPPGLTLNTTNGYITGTPTASSNNTIYTVTAVNAYGTSTAGLQFAISGTATLRYGNQTFVNGIAGTATPAYGSIVGTPTFSVTAGSLPTGVTLNTATGVLSYDGIGAAATANVTLGVSGATSGSATESITITILPAGTGPSGLNYNGPLSLIVNSPVNTTPSLTPGTAGAGGVTYTISPSITAIAGLGFNTATGAITGTPTTAALATSFVITATTIYGSVSQVVTISVGAPPSALSYPSSSYVYWRGDQINNLTPAFTAGTGATTFGATALPAGLLIDPSTGTLYGIPSTAQAATVATITASNSFGSAAFTITFTVVAPPTISYATSYTFTRNTAITNPTPTVTGGINNGFTVTPAMPTGLSYAAGTGIISGTPTVNQTAVSYTATVSSTLNGVSKTATSTFSITIGQGPSALAYSTPQVLGVNTRMTALAPTITPGTGTLTYSASGLPAGVLIDPNTGAIYGTPTATQSATSATITVTSTFGAAASAVVQITVGAPPSNLSYTPVTNAAVGTAVNLSPSITAGTGATTYSISPGLPAGLVFNTATGAITGSTNVVSNAVYTVTASNAYGSTSALFQLSTGIAPAFTYNTPNTYNAGATITPLQPNVTAGTGVSTYAITPALMGGLTMNTVTGEISGTLTTGVAVNNTTFTVTATNAFGASSTSLKIEVLGPPTNLTYGGNLTFTAGTAIPVTVPTVISNPAVLVYSISPALPAGLSFNTSTGAITGTPTVAQAATSYTLTANNFIAPVASYTFTITIVGSAPTGFSYNTPNVFTAGTAITSLSPTISAAVPITYAISPSLPAGLSFNTGTGVISGTPSPGIASAATMYTVTATNNFGSASTSLSIQVQAAPSNLSYGNLVFTVNTPITPVSPTVTASPAPTYSISPTLPAGLTFNTATGVISGTPTVALSLTSFTVTANNGIAPAASTTFTILVGAPPVISYTTPQVYTVGTAITALIPAVQNGATTWSVTPALPSGLSLNAVTGVISGTPAAASAASPYVITAVNAFGSGTATVNLSAGIAPAGLSYTLPGSAFTVNVNVGAIVPTLATGTGPITYSISPSLPAGLSINPQTGVITGSPTVATPLTTYTITASNGFGSVSTTISFSTGVAPAGLSYSTPNSYVAGTAITALNPVITAGSGTLTYSISPALPAGLSLNSSTGVISGTPAAGSSSPATTYTVTASSAFGSVSAQVSITVAGPPASISYGGNYVFVVTYAIVPVVPTVVSSPAPTTYTISPALPAGLSFNTNTGTITGTPTVVSPATPYTVTVSNGIAPAATVVINITVQTPPVFSYVTPQNYATGSAITPLAPAGYGGGTNWTISPALPAGLTINNATGVISGTPTAVNAATQYTVSAVNAYGTGTSTVTISTGNAPAGLAYVLPGSALLLNTPIPGMLPVLTTGTGPFTFSVSPALPAGLSINPATGVITGTPTVATGTTTYTITVTNPYGSTSTTISFATGTPPSNLSYQTPNTFTVNTAITALNPTLTTGPGAVSYAISPALPTGLSIQAATGVISGTPAASTTSPAVNYTVTATNAFGSTSAQLSIAIAGPPTGLQYGNLTFVLNAPIAPVLPVVSASPAPISYTISAPLPPGLTFNPVTGAITGTPVGSPFTGTFTVTVNNGVSPSASTTFTLTVQAAPVISYSTPQNYVTGTPIAALAPVVQGTPNAWIIAPALPAGLSLNASTGIITGTPAVVSAATAYMITATDGLGSGSTTVTIATGNAPAGLSYPMPVALPVNTPINIALPSLAAGTGPFTYSGPVLPPGLSFNPATGAITGTPTAITANGTYTITVSSPFGSTSTTFTLATGVGPSGLTYPTPNVYNAGVTITPLTPTLLMGSATPTYTISPALPAGLSINAATGVISGTPAAGVSVPDIAYTVTATSAYGSASAVVHIAIYGLPTLFTYPTPNVYTVGTAIQQLTPTVAGGVFATYAISPALPAGLVLNTSTGIITGTPTVVSSQKTYTVTGTNGSGSLAAQLQITVNDQPPATFVYNPSPVTVQNGVTTVHSVPVAQGGGAVTNYSISPALPSGMTIDPLTGIISGIPVAQTGTFTYTVTATNTGGSTTATFTMVVIGLPTLFTYPTPNVYTVGTAIPQLTPTVAGGAFATYAISPALPAGLVLNTSTGIITGTPTIVSSQKTYTVTGTNGSGSLTAQLQITVNDQPPGTFVYNPSPVTVQNGVTMVRSTPVIQGGGAVTNYSISPALPSGMTIDPLTGIISGIPVAQTGSTFTYTVTATNTGGSTTATFVMVVTGSPIPTPQNVLTPNGDGRNDRWVIPGITAYPDCEVFIYDKAGRSVYRKKGYTNDWDGTVNGAVLKNDTYYYTIFLNKDGIKPIIGWLTIAR